MAYSSEILYGDNKYLNFMEAICPDGKRWAYVKRANSKGVVIIIPLILDLAEPSTLFLKTCRPPLIAENISEFNLEFPAGLVGDEDNSETIEEALKKELLEETGMSADKFVIKTSKLSSSAGCVSEIATVAIAYIKNSRIVKNPIDDGGVIKDRILVRISEIKEFLKSWEERGQSIGAQTLGGVFYLLEELNIF